MQYGDFQTTRPSAADLKDARLDAHLSTQEAADLCGVHRTTYERQEAGKSRVNLAVYRLLLMMDGWLPGDFEGWGIRKGKLWTPEDLGFTPGEIRTIPILYAQIEEYKRLERQARLKDAESQPTEFENVVPFRRR